LHRHILSQIPFSVTVTDTLAVMDLAHFVPSGPGSAE
jgi:hypothetical protein